MDEIFKQYRTLMEENMARQQQSLLEFEANLKNNRMEIDEILTRMNAADNDLIVSEGEHGEEKLSAGAVAVSLKSEIINPVDKEISLQNTSMDKNNGQ